MTSGRMSTQTKWLDVAAIALLSTGVYLRMAGIERLPLWDEMYYLLAARSWLLDGTFTILDGTYDRAWLFTMILGTTFRLFGEEFSIARVIPALAAGAWVTVVFLWVSRHVGRREAWLASALLCLAPGSLFLGQFVRFYTLQGLVFFCAAACCYELLVGKHTVRMRVALGIAAIVAFGVAGHLQMTTLIGIAAIAAWAAFVVAMRWVTAARDDRVRRFRWLTTWSILALVIVAIMATDLVEYYRSFRTGWAEKTDFRAYHWLLMSQYPVLWALFPVAVVLGIRRSREPALFCAVVFSASFVTLSIGAQRAERFLYFVMPFLFILWSILIVDAWPSLRRLADSAIEQLLPLRAGALSRRVPVAAYLAASVAFMALANPAFPMSVQMLRGGPAYTPEGEPAYWWGQPKTDWASAAPALSGPMQRAAVVVTSNGIPTTFYLGFYDVEIHSRFLLETETGEEFSIGSQTGRPVISKTSSLRQLMTCFPCGLILVASHKWGRSVEFGPETVALIERYGAPIALDERWGVKAFEWRRAVPAIGDEDCRSVELLRRPRG